MATSLSSKPSKLSPLTIELKVMNTLRLRSLPPISPAGAIGTNIQWEEAGSGHLRVSLQKDGEAFVRAGISTRDASKIDIGLRAFRWGFAHQVDDGSFPLTAHRSHSVSFLIAAAGQTELWLRETLFSNHALKDREAARRGISKAVAWLGGPHLETFLKDNGQVHHQSWLLACASGYCQIIDDNLTAMEFSRTLIERTLHAQSPEGYYPEIGGPDTNYNSTSLVWAQRWLMQFPDDALSASVKDSIDRALAYQLSKVSDDGVIDGSGNSRTGEFGRDTQQSKNNLKKGIGYPNTARALAVWGLMTDQPALFDRGVRLLKLHRERQAEAHGCSRPEHQTHTVVSG